MLPLGIIPDRARPCLNNSTFVYWLWHLLLFKLCCCDLCCHLFTCPYCSCAFIPSWWKLRTLMVSAPWVITVSAPVNASVWKKKNTKSDTNMWECKSVFSSHILFFANSLCQDYRGATVCPVSRCCQTCQSVPARPTANQQLLTH